MFARPLIVISLISVLSSCGSSDSPKDIDAIRNENARQNTTIQWIDSIRNFGRITEGQHLAVSFKFKNTGDKPLVIESVHPACGCTVADYPKQPIAPGQEGEITGEFNSEGREGQNHKEITVYTNTAAHTHNLIFDVEVVGKPRKEQQGN